MHVKIEDALTTEAVYIGLREDAPAVMGGRPWKHHLYHVTLRLEGREFSFEYRQGTAHFREPEDAWRDGRFALPDYLSKDGPRRVNPRTGYAEFPHAQRKRFHEERDAAVIRGALESIASDITLLDDYSDDELAADMDMKPSQIAEARGYVARARTFLGRHVQELIDTYRED